MCFFCSSVHEKSVESGLVNSKCGIPIGENFKTLLYIQDDPIILCHFEAPQKTPHTSITINILLLGYFLKFN